MGDLVQLEAYAVDDEGLLLEDVTFEWRTLEAQVAVVNADGVVHALDVGDALIVGSADYASDTIALTVAAAVDTVQPGDSVWFGSFTQALLNTFTEYGGEANWLVSGGELLTTSEAFHAALIRDDVELGQGWVEAEIDYADDAGLILGFVNPSNYYVAALRDDSSSVPDGATRNIEVFRQQAGVFVSLASPGANIAWPRSQPMRIRFAHEGTALRVYVNGSLVENIVVGAIAPGGVGVRTHSEDGATVSARYLGFGWGDLD